MGPLAGNGASQEVVVMDVGNRTLYVDAPEGAHLKLPKVGELTKVVTEKFIYLAVVRATATGRIEVGVEHSLDIERVSAMRRQWGYEENWT
jgi:hypothetical protein